MGYKVVKHGNRAVSSRSGSADVLEGLGVPLDIAPEDAPLMLRERNFVFLFAQRFHPCFRNIAPLRRELGIRTLFNLLGPLINPARPSHILLGVARPDLLRLMAETLAPVSYTHLDVYKRQHSSLHVGDAPPPEHGAERGTGGRMKHE